MRHIPLLKKTKEDFFVRSGAGWCISRRSFRSFMGKGKGAGRGWIWVCMAIAIVIAIAIAIAIGRWRWHICDHVEASEKLNRDGVRLIAGDTTQCDRTVCTGSPTTIHTSKSSTSLPSDDVLNASFGRDMRLIPISTAVAETLLRGVRVRLTLVCLSDFLDSRCSDLAR